MLSDNGMLPILKCVFPQPGIWIGVTCCLFCFVLFHFFVYLYDFFLLPASVTFYSHMIMLVLRRVLKQALT